MELEDIAADAGRAVQEYLATLDDAAFGAASEVTPKFISPSDPAAQWTGAHKGHAFFAYATNYLIDTDHAIILDVEATRAIRQAEVGASRTMLDRTAERFGLKPKHWLPTAPMARPRTCLAGQGARDRAAYPGVRQVQPHDGTFSRSDFIFDAEQDSYTCPEGKTAAVTNAARRDQ